MTSIQIVVAFDESIPFLIPQRYLEILFDDRACLYDNIKEA